MDVAIIGLGEIGGSVFDEIAQNPGAAGLKLIGVDVDPNRLGPRSYASLATLEFSQTIPVAQVYIVCVWSTDQIMDVLKQIEGLQPTALVSIESTIDPTAVEWLKQTGMRDRLVAFPHRFNPNDPNHKVFNLNRIIGAFNVGALSMARTFYSRFMDPALIHSVPFEIAVLAKVTENAYRALEIILAQEIRKVCDDNGTDFDLLRRAVNTKWNIDIKEARDGMGGKCLPKDLGLFNKMFPDFILGRLCVFLNEEYKKIYKEPGK